MRSVAIALVLATCAVARGAGPASADGPRVVVVRSSDLSAYAEVVAGFGAELKADLSEVTLDGRRADTAKIFERVAQAHPALVLAVGPEAAVATRKILPNTPALFCMVPYYQRYALEGPKMTGIALTSDLSLELSALKSVFPELHRVGVLFDPRYSQDVVTKAAKLARIAGLALVPLPVRRGTSAGRALRRAGERIGALVMIADKTVADVQVIRVEMAFAKKRHIPLVGFAGSQVKAGASFAFSPSYVEIGEQAGRLANRIVLEKIDPGALAVVAPEVLDMSINLASEKRLSSGDAVLGRLLHFAAAQGFPLKVFP